MRKLIGVALVVAMAACSSSTEPDPKPSEAVLDAAGEFTLDYGNEVRVVGTVLRVGFTRVVQDSRCPIDAVCVWEGDAEIQLAIALGTGPSLPRTLHLNGSAGAVSTDVGSFRISLVAVQPAAKAGKTIRNEDYQVRLKVAGT